MQFCGAPSHWMVCQIDSPHISNLCENSQSQVWAYRNLSFELITGSSVCQSYPGSALTSNHSKHNKENDGFETQTQNKRAKFWYWMKTQVSCGLLSVVWTEV